MTIWTIQKTIDHYEELYKKIETYGQFMKRLDKEHEFNPIEIATYKEYKLIAEWLKELQHYKDLEEQGRLIELPCKVGDMVYVFGTFIKGIEAKRIVSISIEEDSILIKDDVWDGVICEAHQIGKTVTDKYGCVYGYYLTKEEAEQALAELGGKA